MKKTSLLFVAMAVLMYAPTIFSATPGQHKTKPPAPVTPLDKQKNAAAMEAHKMMGHINLAYLALDMEMPSDAMHHIENAEALAGRLKADAPSLTVESTLKYGKVSYTSKDMAKNYYVPVVDDLFLLSDYDTVYRHLQSIDLKETDAGIVDLNIFVDLRKIEPGLEAAKQDINKKKYQKAQAALAGIFKDAVVEETVVTDPLLVVYDNLGLAKNFIRNGQYNSARYTLQNVKQGLADLEKEKLESPKAQSVKTLKKEITELETELGKKDPTLMQRVSQKFAAWGKTVKSWF